MEIPTGNFIGFKIQGEGEKGFSAFDPAQGETLSEKFLYATPSEFEEAVSLSSQAFLPYSEISYVKRAEFLDAIADGIIDLGDSLLERCSSETGLPLGRITSERGRTCNQLRMFAELLRAGWWLDIRMDSADADRAPLPKPDIRRLLVPIGPIAVYGASNFPLAFSTAGGDTASALAAGCPVVYKSNSSHPGTNALISSAIINAAKSTGMPEGVFSSLNLTHEYSTKLTAHPEIKGVGFTGSRKVGMTLYHTAVNRPEPIQVFAEMSSINPVILLEDALKRNGKDIANKLAGSVTLGSGQFCTNPGMVLLVENEVSRAFLEDFNDALKAVVPSPMLNKNICNSYGKGTNYLKNNEHAILIGVAEKEANPKRNEGLPMAFSVNGKAFLSDQSLREEIFGPATIFVLCQTMEEMREVLNGLEGQLTATIHAEKADEILLKKLTQVIVQKSGRVIFGGYPTGVEVCHAMQHGGPFPATTYAGSTSVGSAALLRFVRPVAYQDFPDHLLPEALQNSNPLNFPRLVDSKWQQSKAAV